MARGGARAGAGRPKGAQNTKTIEQVEAIKATGMTPLEYLTSVYQNETVDEAKRIDAAKAAAPYVHARLSATEISGPDGGPIPIQAEAAEWSIIDAATEGGS
jgi:hypothetical protein